ncbi:MAG: Gfo/Idh/MocA family protein [Anaerolineales bacterium]
MPDATIAVIGTGWWATQAHLPALQANPRAAVVIVDTDPAKLEAAGQTYEHIGAYTSLEDALHAHTIDGAIVAVSHQAHYEVGKAVLAAGLPMLLEKPMVLHASHAKHLVDLAAEKNLELMMGYTFPYIDTMRAAKQRIADGLLGDIEYVTCSMSSMTVEFLRGKPQLYADLFNYPVTGPTEHTYANPSVAGGGQAHLQITHSAAMMFHFAPELRAQIVTAFMNPLDAQVDVADAIAARMTNGAVATIGSTGNLGKGDGGIVEVHLHGSQGRLRADAISGEVYMRLHDGTEEHLTSKDPSYPAGIPSARFIEMLKDGAPNPFPGHHDGLYTVELLDAAYKSAAQDGMPVKVADLYK